MGNTNSSFERMTPLVYADLMSPGYSRLKRGRGFTYLGRSGRRLSRPSIVDYCRSLVIPPAWKEVWISPQQNAHILSTGHDERGRKQYIYHPFWTEYRNRLKFDELHAFSKALPSIRKQVRADMRARRLTRDRVLASVIELLDQGLIRVGNEQYANENGTFGATTLLEKHVTVAGAKCVNLDFRGKSGKQRAFTMDSAALARCIRECQELPGQRLFQYEDDSGRYPVNSSDVNDYLQHVTGSNFTAKHFRTWGGSVAALEYALEELRLGKACTTVSAIKHTASVLGNTPTVARQYYVHPIVVDHIDQGALPKMTGRPRQGLSMPESAFARLLEQ
ncbi:DNA topoisomerase IB [bacterium]|nr:DNA topoisomerase IB [bacterium]